eukprot:g22392.t1
MITLACWLEHSSSKCNSTGSIFCGEETTMSMPHLMMTLALRADCPMLRRWRSRCTQWQEQVGSGTLPRAWKVGLRSFAQEESPAGCREEDLPDNEETCRLFRRAMACLWPLPLLDLNESEAITRRSGRSAFMRWMLTNKLFNNIFCFSEKMSEAQMESKFQGWKTAEVVPHIMSLALAVDGRLEWNDMWQAAIEQLDQQLFWSTDQQVDQQLPQATPSVQEDWTQLRIVMHRMILIHTALEYSACLRGLNAALLAG